MSPRRLFLFCLCVTFVLALTEPDIAQVDPDHENPESKKTGPEMPTEPTEEQAEEEAAVAEEEEEEKEEEKEDEHDHDHEDHPQTPRIAIVGAGIGGSSCAYFLREAFLKSGDCPSRPGLNITVFEMGKVGGRLATIHVAGFEYEAGGSVIHPANRLMKNLVGKMGLKVRENPEEIDGWQIGRFSLYAFGEILFEESSYFVISVFQMIWRYGFAVLLSCRSFVQSMLADFVHIYPFLHSGKHVDSVSDLLLLMASSDHVGKSAAFNDTNISLSRRLIEQGIRRRFVNELVTAAVKTNYGQVPESVHAFVGEVALAGAEGGLWSVQGGNKRVPKELLHRSQAHFAQAQVNSVTLLANGKYSLAFNTLFASETHDYLFSEGANEGRPLKIQTSRYETKEVFDIVVLATPMTRDKSLIEIKGLPHTPHFPGHYHRTVATFVHGEINPKFFGYEGVDDMTSANFFVDKLNNLNSIDLQIPVEVSPEMNFDDLPMVWKIFSQTPLTENEIGEIFLSREEIQVMDWLAYPHYRPQQRDMLGNFTLHKGLFHINAVEFAASAMEMSVVAAKNVANSVHSFWTEKHCPSVQEQENEDDDEDKSTSWWKLEL